MKIRKHFFYDMKTAAMVAVFIIFYSGIMIFSAQKVDANPESFRNKYRLEQNDLLVSLPNIAPLAYEENGVKKGILVELVTAMDSVYQTEGVEIAGTLKKGSITIAGIYPFKRSIFNVKEGNADFHLPYLVNPHLSSDLLKRESGVAYSKAIIFYANFPIYATKDFAALLSEFERQAGKEVFQLSNQEDYKKFNDFLENNKIEIEVDRAHTHLYPFPTLPTSSTFFSLRKLSMSRINAYIHNMQECDTELRVKNIDTSNLEKIRFMKIVVRMVVPATEKGNETDRIISGLVWKLQGRSASDVPLEDTLWSGFQKEVPYNSYQQNERFRNSQWFTLMDSIWDIPFTKEFR